MSPLFFIFELMKYAVSFFLALFIFLAGFAKGPRLHYCFSSHTLSAQLYADSEIEDPCLPEAEESGCCVLKSELEKENNCCEDFDIDVEVSEYSGNGGLTYSFGLNFVALSASFQNHIFRIVPLQIQPVLPTYYSHHFAYSGVPIYIKNAIFRI